MIIQNKRVQKYQQSGGKGNVGKRFSRPFDGHNNDASTTFIFYHRKDEYLYDAGPNLQ